MATTEILDAMLEPGINASGPVAMVQALDLHGGDEVRLRVFRRGQRQPDHIATHRVFHTAGIREPGSGTGGSGERPRTHPLKAGQMGGRIGNSRGLGGCAVVAAADLYVGQTQGEPVGSGQVSAYLPRDTVR